MKSFNELSAVDQDAGAVVIAAAYGGPPPPSIIGRLCRNDGGEWLLSYRVCTLTPNDYNERQPGNFAAFKNATAFDPATMGSGGGPLAIYRHVATKHGTIPEVLALLADGAEKDIERYDLLQAGADAWAKKCREEQAAMIAKQEEAQRLDQQQRTEFRFEQWTGVPQLAQVLYQVALDVDAGRSLPASLRDVAATLRNPNPRFNWPRKKWW